MAAKLKDRVGLGWRSEIAAHIFTHLEQIDALEVIADNYFNTSNKSLRALQFLATQKPVILHGVGMGLASCNSVADFRLEKMARLIDCVQPESWSEHLAFVRAGAIEIGHLAAPPRNSQTVEGTLNNIDKAKKIIGCAPQLENIATLISPPASAMTETDWVSRIIRESNSNLLLDLHNLYANAKNFNLNPEAMLRQLPLDHVSTIHLSGGCWIKTPDGEGERLLDDHIHDVPQEVFELLTLVAQLCRHPLTVLIERDGNFQDFGQLLAQVQSARRALSIGRQMMRQAVNYELV